MKELSFIFNTISTCSYDVTSVDNGTQGTPYWTGAASFTLEPEMSALPTYQQLVQRLKERFSIPADLDSVTEPPQRLQQFRNHLSTLNSYLASVGKTLESRLGVEFGSQFQETLKKYLEEVVSVRTRRDRRQHLRLMLQLSEELKSGQENEKRLKAKRKAQDSPETAFGDLLRRSIAAQGVRPKALAKRIGVSPSALQRWLKGALPNQRGIPTVRRLELELGLQRDSLVDLARVGKHALNAQKSECFANLPVIGYRTGLRRLWEDKYILSEEDMPPQLLDEWRALLDYKTSPAPMLKRTRRGVWRCVPADSIICATELSRRGSQVCPSAGLVAGYLRKYLGFVLRHREESSVPLPHHALSLAMLAHPELLGAFLTFMTERADGVVHTGHQVFCQIVGALVRPQTGYLWQKEEFAQRLPDCLCPPDGMSWRQMCERAHEVVMGWKRMANDLRRHPDEPLAAILAMDYPIRPVLGAIKRIEQAAVDAPAGSISEARFRRDALLLSMLVSVPLRLRNYQMMTYSLANFGNVYRTSEGKWRIRFGNAGVKNGGTKSARGEDIALPSWVVPKLEAYLEEYRGVLLEGKTSKYLFIGAPSASPWGGLARRVFNLTRKYIDNCPGFGPHAFRHIVATNWLLHNPNDFVTAAALLGDSVDVVLRHYAHLKRETSFARHEKLVQALLDEL